MKKLGIVRRVDDIGRIVIPKDVRKMLGIEEGQPMEMFVDSENNLILKKYKTEEKIELEEDIKENKIVIEIKKLDKLADALEEIAKAIKYHN